MKREREREKIASMKQPVRSLSEQVGAQSFGPPYRVKNDLKISGDGL